MDTSQRQWQTTIWLDEKETEGKTFYGDTLASLRQNIRDWLTENKPTFFCSADVKCNYADGTQTSKHSLTGKIEEGWYLRDRVGYRLFDTSPREFETALEEFLAEGILPEKGPDYQDTAIIDGKLQLHLIKTVRHEGEHADNDLPQRVNSLLKRGWYLIAKERSEYVLGHPEEDAI